MTSQLSLSFEPREEGIPTLFASNLPPQEITYRGCVWYLVEHEANRGKGSFRSEVWDHGDQYIALGDPEKVAWRCQHCKEGNSLISLPRKSTGSAVRHLNAKHPEVHINKGPGEGSSEIDRLSINTNEDRLVNQSTLKTVVNVKLFRYHLLRWIVKQQIAFDEVEDEDFQAMLLALSTSVEKYLVQSSQTIRNWAQSEYVAAQSQVKQILVEARSRIHISFDLWTSPNGYALCAICAHFVGSNIRNNTVLLGLKRMKGPHSGENIAEVMIPVLKEYEVAPRLGVFIADNADSNDTAIRSILTQIRPDLDPVSHRARCLGHIINLAAKAFLFSSDTEAFESIVKQVTDDTPFDSKTMKEAQAAWRKKGAIGRFHNLTVFIRSSPQRREAFRACVVGDRLINNLMVIQDNSTRWNSTYQSIHRGLKLKRRLRQFCDESKAALGEDCISDEDWIYLEEVAEALEPFHQATMRAQGNANRGHHGAV
jgi:hypothetical protein